MRNFSSKLIGWYNEHKRSLPWRETCDPYKIWLSEIILQQTRVNQGLPYYLRFIEKFPDVFSLGSAAEQEVLRLWQGLGYYTRARNLHKCAKHVAFEKNGEFPDNFESLTELPGIGEYTAAAIASFCFKEKVAVLDGNVFRVLSRIFGEDAPCNSPEGKAIFTTLANALICSDFPEVHNQAIMEFGATWCTPKAPKCDQCIFAKECFAFQNKMQDVLPVKIKTKKSRRRYFYYFVVRKNNSLLMKKRDKKDIWNGLFDFYMVEKSRPAQPIKLMAEDTFLSARFSAKDLVVSNSYRHILSHQVIHSKFILLNDENIKRVEEEPLKYYSLKKIHDLPKPVLISRFLKDFNFL